MPKVERIKKTRKATKHETHFLICLNTFHSIYSSFCSALWIKLCFCHHANLWLVFLCALLLCDWLTSAHASPILLWKRNIKSWAWHNSKLCEMRRHLTTNYTPFWVLLLQIYVEEIVRKFAIFGKEILPQKKESRRKFGFLKVKALLPVSVVYMKSLWKKKPTMAVS